MSFIRSVPFIRSPLASLHRSHLFLSPSARELCFRRGRRRHQGTAVAASAASYGGSGGGRDHSDGCDHDDGHDILGFTVEQSAAPTDGGTQVLVMQTLSAILPTVALSSRHRLTRSIYRSRIPDVILALCPCTRHAQREETAQSERHGMAVLRLWNGLPQCRV